MELGWLLQRIECEKVTDSWLPSTSLDFDWSSVGPPPRRLASDPVGLAPMQGTTFLGRAYSESPRTILFGG